MTARTGDKVAIVTGSTSGIGLGIAMAMATHGVEAAQQELLREKQQMLQFTTPEQIGALAVVLCGDATATVTGAAWPVDGGWTAQ